MLISVKSIYFCKHEDINLAHECMTKACFCSGLLIHLQTLSVPVGLKCSKLFSSL